MPQTATACLGFGSFPAAGTVTAAECPEWATLIVKSVYLSNYSGAEALIQIYLQDPPTGTGASIFWDIVGANETIGWQGWAVLEHGQRLIINSPATTVHYWVSGTALIGQSAYTDPPPNLRFSAQPIEPGSTVLKDSAV